MDNLPNIERLLQKAPAAVEEERFLFSLASELAKDIFPPETVLAQKGIGIERWQRIKDNPVFRKMFAQQVAEWNAVSSTPERMKLKMLTMIEDAMPELHKHLHDPKEALGNKVKLLEAIMKGAEFGQAKGRDTSGVNDGEKIVINIDLGGDVGIKRETAIPAPSIDLEAAE